MSLSIQYETDILLISPLDPHLHVAQSQILWPVEYLTYTSVYWNILCIKSRSLNMLSSPHPKEAAHEIWLQSAKWLLRIKKFENI